MSFGDIIQSKAESNFPDTNDTSIAVEFDSTPTEGNLLIACHFTGAANSTAPSGFSEAVALTAVAPSSDEGAIYYKVAGSGESTTITAGSGSGDEHMLAIYEVEGPWNATPLDQTANNGPTTSSSPSTGTTGITSQADEFAIALITNRDDTVTFSSWTNSFTEGSDGPDSQFKTFATAYRVLTSTGTYSTGATASGSDIWMGGIATFKKQAAAGALSIPVAMRTYRNMRT